MAEHIVPEDEQPVDPWDLVLDILTEDEQIALAQELDLIIIDILTQIDGGE